MIPFNFKEIPAFAKTTILIFIILASIILVYSIVELNQSRKELLRLMEEQSHSLSESILTSSENALRSYEMIDEEMRERLFNNANLVRILLSKNQINNHILTRIANENGIHRINIFNNKGEKLFTNHEQFHEDLEERFSPKNVLSPIFNGITDTLTLGIREARYEDGFRFAIAIAGKNRSAIVLNQDAEGLLNFRRSIGFGALLKGLTENYGIKYAILQDTTGIIAASGELLNPTNLADDKFLNEALKISKFSTRVIENDSLEIFEAVHPFHYKNEIIGLLRLGLPADPLLSVNKSNKIRVISLSLILLLLGSSILAYTFKKQNYELLKKDYKDIESYSQLVIENVSDAVIVLDENRSLFSINKAAENLFQINSKNLVNRDVDSYLSTEITDFIQSEDIDILNITTKIKGSKKHLLASKNSFYTSKNELNTILVFRDLTQLRRYEEQVQRKERLVAMGELASGVAHEIRNPLNTISTITQQLRKDFHPAENKEEYEMLTTLVNKEINRINDTVKDFLRFSRPEKISLSKFRLSDLIDQIEKQYETLLGEKSIRLISNIEWDGDVNWDKNQILQALMNIVQNAYDSINDKGEIKISAIAINGNVQISLKDNGPGIPQHIQNKIFNLYFTTKAKGTGIGLSIVQRIVFEHGGSLEFESSENSGTLFTLIIPINPKLSS